MDTVQLLMIGWAIQAKNVNWNAKKWKRPPKSSKIKMFVFGLHSTSHDRPIWSMDLNPICHPSPANKMKCSFLDYIQLLMICQAGQWATPLQPKKWNAHFWITVQWWWWTRAQKTLIFGLHDDPGRGWWTRTPSATPLQPKKWNAHFWITFNFWWSARLVKTRTPSAIQAKKKCSTFKIGRW